MSRRIIDIGTIGNDGTGDSIRDSFRKVNDNFRELYSSLGLGDNLKFIEMDDTPSTFIGSENAVLAIGQVDGTDEGLGVKFKQIVGVQGIIVDNKTNPNEIQLSTEFSEIVADTSPQLGGNLSARSGGNQYRILDLATPTTGNEASTKQYTDTKISRGGIDGIDPATGRANAAFGTMTGPLILSRDPVGEDDEIYGGLIAATKSYVDRSSFGSVANLYVAKSGEDDRVGIDRSLQGRALSYAYKTIEAALKRAEELMLQSRNDIGPYRKVLTYGNGSNTVTLSNIDTSPSSGSGFSGSVFMSIDTFDLATPGINYDVGDIITVPVPAGTTGSPAQFEVLSTQTTPGKIVTYRQISSGVYEQLPGTSAVVTTTDSENGEGATLNLTYKVNKVDVDTVGSGYSLVSVRITGGGSTSSAFGTAVVDAGEITSIIITDEGSGFTSIPTVVADLPRFLLDTGGQRTDFTGDVETDTPVAFRGRDIREGLYLQGVNSGALAQILAHEGELDSNGNEIFDVDIQFGQFEIGEPIAYGDVTKIDQITILVESGVYEENLPLKIPQNVAIVGNEFRRVIIKPRQGVSSSPWAFQNFRRDLTIGTGTLDSSTFDITTGEWNYEALTGDQLIIADRLFGYHYLSDSAEPVYPLINNKGGYNAAANLLELNRDFLQNEVIAWNTEQIITNTPPFSSSFEYNENLCKRDVGLIVDAICFDLRYGGYNRTVSAALKYYQSASSLIAITTQLSETIASIEKLNSLALSVISNTSITPVYQSVYSQIIDGAFISEDGSDDVIDSLITALKDIMDESGPGYGSVNQPKNNEEMDMFLMNDATILRAVTGQGHGGFMCVLDPEGQVLAKSPYIQESASFSRSKDTQVFAGGMLVDGFAGNLQFKHETTVAGTSNTRITVSGLKRLPQLPASFIVNDTVQRVNYVRDYVYNPAGSTGTFVLDETTPFGLNPGPQTCTISTANPAVITKAQHGLQANATVVFESSGSLPSGIVAGKEYYVAADGLTNDTFQITLLPSSTISVATTSGGSGSFTYQRIYELLMPGNRSLLCNDYTQVNDLGYGVIATNGGLVEAVSMFTYYCHISYYSVNGGQIRSVGGSSSHGNYALVAQGADPLEVPTPTNLYYDLAQRVDCYAPPASEYVNVINGLFIFVTNYDYEPLGGSELEIDHGNIIYRYPVSSASTTGLPAGISRLNITSDETGNFEGLFAAVPNGTKMSLRANTKVILTNDLSEVATRPSTGLILAESGNEVYRVLQFEIDGDTNGPYEVDIPVASPSDLSLLMTVTEIDTNVCTTSQNHRLKVGDVFIPTSTSNGFTSGTTYYIIDVPFYNQFTVSTSAGGSAHTLSNGTGLSIKGKVNHKFVENWELVFASSGTLPTGLIAGETYYVITGGLTDTTFRISADRGGSAINITGAGSGTHTLYTPGLTKTTLRENYNYVDLTLFQPGEYSGATTTVASFTTGTPGVVSTSSPHNLSIGDCIRFESTGNLPVGLTDTRNYFVYDNDYDSLGAGSLQFTVSSEHPNLTAQALSFSGTPTGSAEYGPVTGKAGDSSFAVVAVAPQERSRVPGSRVVFKGEEYTILTYESEVDTGEAYARVTLDRPLEDSMIDYGSAYSMKSSVAARSVGAKGNLTIRISLTRVTSHDLLEIGTGSYADTNYPKEIYGASVNALNAEAETQERDVGRVFYVTTDQFGNFSVGPYFRVDQGTGQVTFAASIALSNLDGIGFKRGVPVSEFSVDSAFSDNAIDTVPTENATRLYIERRLGLSHGGSPITSAQLIPPATGGFMALDGQLAMKGNMDLDDNRIVNVGDPINPQDAINLRNLTFENIQNFDITDVQANDILVFTGVGNQAINTHIVGDVSFEISSTANELDIQINPDVILDADVNSAAGILQSKLLMNRSEIVSSSSALLGEDDDDAGQEFRGAAAFDVDSFAEEVRLTFSTTVTLNAGEVIYQGSGAGVPRGIVTTSVSGSTTVVLRGSSDFAVGATAIYKAVFISGVEQLPTVISLAAVTKVERSGFIDIKDGGLTISKLAVIPELNVLGRSNGGTGNVEQVPFSTVVNSGGGVKKSQYSVTGFLRRKDAGSFTSDTNFEVIDSAAGSSVNVSASKLIQRSSQGDFGGRYVDVQALYIDEVIAADTTTSATGGSLRIYNYGGNGGIRLESGSLSTDKVTYYDNDLHIFRDESGNDAQGTVSSNTVRTLNLTTGNAITSGTITGRWTLTGTAPNESRLQATYSADLAEYYEGDIEYEVGTVLVFGGEKEVTISGTKGDRRVAGVVSNTAAFAMYEGCPGKKNLVALQGRVPVKVIGKVEKGDILVTSDISGVACVDNDPKPGTIIGKALENYDSDQVGTIEVAVGRN